MMAQYLQIKAANPDYLLFYRMGDFYELFFEDAEIAARALGITLTKRGKHLGADIAMCGVPHHSSDEYLQRLIRLGHRVAVCEQIEDPAEAKKRGAKSVVRREVKRLVTPGTLTEDSLLDARAHNYLACLVRIRAKNELALSWLDISTGEFFVSTTSTSALAGDLARLCPRELLVADSLLNDDVLGPVLKQADTVLAPLPASRFDSAAGERRIREYFGVAAIEAFGEFGRAHSAACGALIDYVLLTQVGKLPVIHAPKVVSGGHCVQIDSATRANLEITRTLKGEKAGSLLSVIDRTITGPGARLLAAWLSGPLTDPRAINQRLDAVAFFADHEACRSQVRKALGGATDIGRALARLKLERGSPRDLAAIAQGLGAGARLTEALAARGALDVIPPAIEEAVKVLAADDHGIAGQLNDALVDDLPVLARDGGFVRAGFDAELDENRSLRDEARKFIAALQARYSKESGIKTLKVKHNNVLGYFVEVTAQHGSRLMSEPLAQTFIHRQTLANVMRFTTSELGELEQRMAAAAGKAVAIELDIFARLSDLVISHADDLSKRASAIASLDVYAGLGELAVKNRYVRPQVDDSRVFDITAGRHPVVEAALARSGESAFIANDCNLTAGPDGDGKNLWLLTGPNMAGKSTFLRQNALIALLAQAGSFVPAQKAHIGVIDALFSRVGAADDLARGRSTFMVEMVETATILNQAGERALVILDEIGRGTATYDGLSIAWGCVEHLHEVNRCRTLFATHYHELTALAETLDRLANMTMKVREWKGEVVFVHEVTSGSADRSYGIQVAKLAGLPEAVIARASQVLAALESKRDET
ncbi:MAG TPA: DNA mismatch repair protein MutS, partial [Rhizobiales bacterium]|nr:DNA mismatch repair protein MutS [Hyphomicrobiales bacterium]